MRYAPALICLLLFVAVAVAVVFGATLPFDMAVRDAFHSISSGDLTGLALGFTVLGSAPVWVPLTLIAMVVFWLAARRKQALIMAAAMTGAVLLENGLKLLFHRTRPEVFFGTSPETYSFPSGHALFATCFYGALAAILAAEFKRRSARAVLWSAAVLMVLCIGWSRIYLGVHYPSDVLAGYFVGTTWLLLLGGVGMFKFRSISLTTMSE